ncbi:WD40/YVTN/BNR-like repeat-containing protein [Fibrobacterota bacterium]
MEEQTSGTTEDLNGAYFTDENAGWICGNNGTILNTTNKGSTWENQTSGTTENLHSVYFVDENTGWAVGEKGTILVTENKGLQWNKQESGTTTDLNSVFFTEQQKGWVTGNEGAVLKTANAGETWTQIKSGTLNDLYSVCFFGVKTGWVAGENGTIIKTITGGSTGINDDNYFLKNSPCYVKVNTYISSMSRSRITISYGVMHPSFINLKVYDVGGREIQTLAAGFHNKGHYAAHFNTGKIHSGLYVLKLDAGSVKISKKVYVLK